MTHRGIILLLVIATMLVAAALGSGSKMERAKDRAGIAAEEERLQDGKEKAQSWADWALIKAYQVLRYGKDASKEAADKVKDKAGDVADKTSEALKNGASGGGKYTTEQKDKVVDSAARGYQEAEHKVEEAYEKAKNTASEKTKSKYEAAKEELSDAAGKLGAAMGAGAEEL